MVHITVTEKNRILSAALAIGTKRLKKFLFSPFRLAVEKLRSEEYDEIIPLCTSEIEQTPSSSYQQLAILLRGTMRSLMSQAEDALSDLNSILDAQDLDKKVNVLSPVSIVFSYNMNVIVFVVVVFFVFFFQEKLCFLIYFIFPLNNLPKLQFKK